MSPQGVFIGDAYSAAAAVAASTAPLARGQISEITNSKVSGTQTNSARSSMVLANYLDEEGNSVYYVKELSGADSSLVHHEVLDKFNVTVSRSLKLPICGWCNYAVEIKSLNSHLRKKKKKYDISVPQNLSAIVEEVVCSMPGSPDPIIPKPDGGPHAPVQGLRVSSGLVCGNELEEGGRCGVAVFSVLSMKSHWRRKICKPKNDGSPMYKHGQVQSVFSGNRRCFFEVTKVDEVGEEEATDKCLDYSKIAKVAIESAHEDLSSRVDGVGEGTADKRCLDMFLERTKWAADIAGLDITKAIALVAPFDNRIPVECVLNKACCMFLQDVATYCENHASFLTRRYLMDWDGAQGVGSKAFEARKDEKTMNRYGNLLSRLVLMVYRKCSDPKFAMICDLPQIVEEAVGKLRMELRNRSLDPCNRNLQEVLSKVLGTVLCSTLNPGESRRRHVASQFLMFANLSSRFGWLGPSAAGHMVAALQYCCRIVVLSRIRDDPDKSWGSFLEHCKLTLSNRNNSFCAISEIMSIAAAVNRSENWAVPNVTWVMNEKPYRTLCIDGEVLDLDELKLGLQKHSTAVEDHFKKRVLLGLDVTKEEMNIIIKKMGDNLRSREHGFGIADERCNPLLGKMKGRLVTHILTDEKLRLKYVGRDGVNIMTNEVKWRKHALREWMEDVEKFIQLFLPLIHITSGQPARGEELATLAVRNSESQLRNVYWAYSTVMMLTRYHKGRSAKGVARPVPRFLPSQFVPIFLLYLGLAKPTEVLFAKILHENGSSASKAHWRHLFCKDGKRWTGKNVCNAFRKSMHQVIGLELRFSSYRHACIAFMKHLIKHKFPTGFGDVGGFVLEEGNETRSVNVFDEQACHSSNVGEHLYAVSEEDLSDLTKGEGLSYRIVSGLWSAVVGYPQENLMKWIERSLGEPANSQAPETNREECLCSAQRKILNSQERGKRFWAKSVSHAELSIVGKKRPLPDILEQNCENATSLSRSQRICYGSGGWCDKSSLSLVQASPSQITVSEAATMQEQLKRFFGAEDAAFKSSYQLLAVLMVKKRADDVLVVMPTGSGKSLTYMLPAWMEQNLVGGGGIKLVTVVIVPLISLMEDLRRRCVYHSLEVGLWKDRQRKPTILLVPVEVVGTDVFRHYCNSLAATGCLARIVVEEAHTRLTWEGFRPKMRNLSQIRPEIPTPIILVTGTAPPSHVFELSVAFSSPFKIVRMSTCRPNLRYSVQNLDDSNQFSSSSPHADGGRGLNLVRKRVVQLIHKFIKDLPASPKERAIVFCPSKMECRELLESLRVQKDPKILCRMYHSDITEEARVGNQQAWQEGQALVMVATCAFGTGIDYPSVRLVVHSGLSYSMLDYAQETGRAGRDGNVSDCVLITHKDCTRRYVEEAKKRSSEMQFEGRKIVNHLGGASVDHMERALEDVETFTRMMGGCQDEASGVQCRRQVMQEFLDGYGENCRTRGAECVKCDVCEESLRKDSAPSESQMELTLYAPRQQISLPQSQELFSAPSSVLLDSLSNSPSELVKLATTASHTVRKNAAHLYSEAMDIGRRMQTLCSYCVVNIECGGYHSESECRYMKNRCFRCMQKGHKSSSCPIIKCGAFQSKRRCFKCFVDHPEASTSKYGSQCQTGFSVFRDIAIGLWFFQKKWLVASFEDLRMIAGESPIERYGKWLYSIFRGNHVPRILVVVILWFKHRRELASQQSSS